MVVPVSNSNKDIDKRYPLSRIEDSDDWFQIEILEYIVSQDLFGEIPGNDTFDFGKPGTILGGGLPPIGNALQKINAKDVIVLPMPQNIQDMNAVGWGEDSLNNLAAAGLIAAKNAIKNKDYTGGIIDQLKNVAEGVGAGAKSGALQQLVQNYFASQAVNAMGANTSLDGVLARTTGQILNPNMELLFKSVTLRSFNFEWDLIPRSVPEKKVVFAIINTLKKDMAPRGGSKGGLFIQSPKVFRLRYMSGSGSHPFLHSFKPCALVQMGVNYTGNGSYATYWDKTPVHLKLSLSFQELNPIYAEDYEEVPNSSGVGY